MTAPACIVTPIQPLAARIRIGESAHVVNADQTKLLTSGLARGDEEAFREFHATYFDRLFRYLIVVSRGDEQAARDALQETLTRVARHARVFDDAAKFWSWLTVLARSAAADGGRRRRSYWRLLINYARTSPAQEPLIPADNSEQHLENLMQEAIGTLEADDRALVEGKYIRGASVRDLALKSGLSESAIESRLVRARRELRTSVLKLLKNEELRGK